MRSLLIGCFHEGNVSKIWILHEGECREVLLDREDFPRLGNGRVGINHTHAGYYARIWINGSYVKLHRLIMAPPKHLVVDHLNGNGLDNRKSNLRITTISGNSIRRTKVASNNTSGYRGVSRNGGRWRATIMICGKSKHLGCFGNPIEAALVVRDAIRRHPGYPENVELTFSEWRKGHK